MSNLNEGPSHHARDTDDNQLLKQGKHNELVESYYGHVVRRCRAKARSEAEALEVAAEVAIRLIEELGRGRRYTVPYRVVVNKVIDWKWKEHHAPKPFKEEEFLDHHEDSGPDPYQEFETDYDLEVLLEGFAPKEYEVAVLRLRDGLEPDEIAERLDIKRNAVDQAWHRAKQKLRERIDPDDA